MMPSKNFFGFVIPLWSLVRCRAGTLGSGEFDADTSDSTLDSCPAASGEAAGAVDEVAGEDAVGVAGAGAAAVNSLGPVAVSPRGELGVSDLPAPEFTRNSSAMR